MITITMRDANSKCQAGLSNKGNKTLCSLALVWSVDLNLVVQIINRSTGGKRYHWICIRETCLV